jgi:hypothetical protein
MFHLGGSIIATFNNLLVYYSRDLHHGTEIHELAKQYVRATDNENFLTWFALVKLVLAFWPTLYFCQENYNFVNARTSP